MKAQPRWISNTIEAANACTTQMPWERGARRAEFIARRNANEPDKTKITLAPIPDYLTEVISA